MTTPTSTLAPFVRQRTIPLTTYRRDGTPVGTPVHLAVDGDRAFARTWDTTWKVKRVRHNSQVELAPSTFWGTPTGSAVHARARLLGHKYGILHGFLIPLVHRLRCYTTVDIEPAPVERSPSLTSARPRSPPSSRGKECPSGTSHDPVA